VVVEPNKDEEGMAIFENEYMSVRVYEEMSPEEEGVYKSSPEWGGMKHR
jgi:hypothetical protein